MLWKKKHLDDKDKTAFVEAISDMLAVQMRLAPSAELDADECLKARVLGYVYGYIDCGLQSKDQDMSDVSVGIPITWQVLRRLFPGSEGTYLEFLKEHLADLDVVAGMMRGGQDFADLCKPNRKGTPMGLAKILLGMEN